MDHLPVHKERCPCASSPARLIPNTSGPPGGGCPSVRTDPPPPAIRSGQTRSAAYRAIGCIAVAAGESSNRRLGLLRGSLGRREPCGFLRLETGRQRGSAHDEQL